MLSVNIFDLAQSSLSRTKKTLFFGCAKISTPRDDGNSLLSTSFGSRLASCCFVFSCVQCCSQCLPILSHSKYVYPVYLLSGVFMKQRSTSHNVSRALASNGVYSHEWRNAICGTRIFRIETSKDRLEIQKKIGEYDEDSESTVEVKPIKYYDRRNEAVSFGY